MYNIKQCIHPCILKKMNWVNNVKFCLSQSFSILRVTDIDDCASSQCDGNGTLECQDRLNSYKCECKPGFSGDLCEIGMTVMIQDSCDLVVCSTVLYLFDEGQLFCVPGGQTTNNIFFANNLMNNLMKDAEHTFATKNVASQSGHHTFLCTVNVCLRLTRVYRFAERSSLNKRKFVDRSARPLSRPIHVVTEVSSRIGKRRLSLTPSFSCYQWLS